MKFALIGMIILNLSCSTLTNSHSPTLDSRFHNIVRHSGKKLDHFVIKVNSITDSTFIKAQDITGFVSINAIIDEQGNVESTFIRNKINSKTEMLHNMICLPKPPIVQNLRQEKILFLYEKVFKILVR